MLTQQIKTHKIADLQGVQMAIDCNRFAIGKYQYGVKANEDFMEIFIFDSTGEKVLVVIEINDFDPMSWVTYAPEFEDQATRRFKLGEARDVVKAIIKSYRRILIDQEDDAMNWVFQSGLYDEIQDGVLGL